MVVVGEVMPLGDVVVVVGWQAVSKRRKGRVRSCKLKAKIMA